MYLQLAVPNVQGLQILRKRSASGSQTPSTGLSCSPVPCPAQPAWPGPAPPRSLLCPTPVLLRGLGLLPVPSRVPRVWKSRALLTRPDPGACASPHQEASQRRLEKPRQSSDSHVTLTLASSYLMPRASATQA